MKGVQMAKITLPGWRCERCGHEWVARQEWEDQPRVCPKCKSPYWATPRKTPKKKEDDNEKGDEE
jgi:predicted Zn-ribbon and HTH transcriptional regulator